MNATNFTYWLEGWVEIARTSLIGTKELQIIQDHLKIVTKDDEVSGPKGAYLSPNQFVSWLEGFLDERKELNISQSIRVVEKLGSVFNKITPDRKMNPGDKLIHIDTAINNANKVINNIREGKPMTGQERRACHSPNKYC